MEPTLSIRFAALSDPDAKTAVQTYSDDISVTAKTVTIVHYTQSVVTLNAPVEARASIEIPETGLYLFVLATGHLIMERTGTDDIPVASSENHCQALYLCKGDYFVTFAPGKHRLVCFASATAWVQRIRQSLPLINEVSATIQPHQQALIFPRYRLPEILTKHLLSFTYRSADGISTDELDHFHQLNRLMAHYDSLLIQTRKAGTSHRNYEEIVRAFFRHCEHSLLKEISTIETVAAAIDVSPKTLSRAFRTVSKGTITPGRALQHLRMATAHRLLSHNESTSVQETAHLLGYAETSAFTKAYHKAWGHLPSEACNFAGDSPPTIRLYLPE